MCVFYVLSYLVHHGFQRNIFLKIKERLIVFQYFMHFYFLLNSYIGQPTHIETGLVQVRMLISVKEFLVQSPPEREHCVLCEPLSSAGFTRPEG